MDIEDKDGTIQNAFGKMLEDMQDKGIEGFLQGPMDLLMAAMKVVVTPENLARIKYQAEKEKMEREEADALIRQVISSADPFRRAMELGHHQLMVSLIVFDFHTAGLLERMELPEKGPATLQNRYRLKKGVDTMVLNPWESRVASQLNEFTTLSDIMAKVDFTDIEFGQPTITASSAYPEIDSSLLERFFTFRSEAIDPVYISC